MPLIRKSELVSGILTEFIVPSCDSCGELMGMSIVGPDWFRDDEKGRAEMQEEIKFKGWIYDPFAEEFYCSSKFCSDLGEDLEENFNP